MEQQWHDILLHDDAGDAGFHKGAPLIVAALQTISNVRSISSATRLGLHVRETACASASHEVAFTFTDKHIHEEQSLHSRMASPLVEALRMFFKAASKATRPPSDVVAVAGLDGLLIPAVAEVSLLSLKEAGGAATELPPLLRAHPLFSYEAFLHSFDRLNGLVSHGEVFSACEPRVKIVQSRFNLYRAYNSGREDEYHPTFGGGDIRRAPKCDLRRIETCMSASSVVRFLEELRRDKPHYPLYAEEGGERDPFEQYHSAERAATARPAHARPSPVSSGSKVAAAAVEGRRSGHAPHAVSNTSVEEALRRFFRSNAAEDERVLTEEGLCLRPSYATDSADRWLSLEQLANSGDNPRAEHASRLLRHLLCTSGGADGKGELLAQLLQPLLKRMSSSGSSYDRLELELTVSGREAGELPQLAKWCRFHGLLDSYPALFFRVHVTQDAYVGVQGGRAHRQAAEDNLGFRKQDTAGEAAPQLFLGDVLHNIFAPVWEAYLAAAAGSPRGQGAGEATSSLGEDNAAQRLSDMQALLRRTTGFSVSLTHAAAVQEMPVVGDPSKQFPLPPKHGPTRVGVEDAVGETTPAAALTPPDAFFVYHIWRNLHLINAFLLAGGSQGRPIDHSQDDDAAAAEAATKLGDASAWNTRSAFTFTLHGGSNSRTLFGESSLGLLLADTVVNPSTAFEWSPFTYLYMLTQRHVILTPSRNRCCGPSVKHTLGTVAVPLGVQAGLHLSIATLDPLFYNTTNDALCEELMELKKQRGLANADVTEMCLRSVEAGSGCLSWSDRRYLMGYAWPRAQSRYNQFSSTQVSSLRLHHRACALEHELNVLFAVMRHHIPNTAASTGVPASLPAISKDGWDELSIRAQLFLPSRTEEDRSGAMVVERQRVVTEKRPSQGDPAALLFHRQPIYRTREARMQYPRIVVSGPDRMGPSDAAKRLMKAMAIRESYQQFVIHPQQVRHSRMPPSASAATSSPVWKDGVLTMEDYPAGGNAGVVTPTSNRSFALKAPALPTWAQFQRDARSLRRLASADPTVAKFASKRLDMLESKYKLHVALTNDDEENFVVFISTQSAAAAEAGALMGDRCGDGSGRAEPQRKAPTSMDLHATATGFPLAKEPCCRVVQSIRGDAHNCFKVDVHCHMASGITAKTLLHFMQGKLREHPNDVVSVDPVKGTPITLVEFFHKLFGEQQLQRRCNTVAVERTHHRGRRGDEETAAATTTAQVVDWIAEMPIAALQVHAGKATFHRFDRFNHRFSPMGMSSLRSLFLKTENFMQGRYFAELIRESFRQNELEGGTFTENRLSIYGGHKDEWDRLSRWFVLHGVSHHTNSWMIQVPRLFHLYRRAGQLQNFQEMLKHIFEPLWQASMYPAKYPYLHFLLSHISGFDSVDNESDREPDQTIDTPPIDWSSAENPPFAYYMFYMWSNITSLNRYRASRGLNVFQFRPHAGESGDPDHMADVFALADGIGHGINLDKRSVLQYLYYLSQIPLAVVPMSNNALFCRYKDHPLPAFFYRGLNVALGTDGPLIFHRTEQPLLEEYGTAEALWNLSAADVCELAANSVRMSGFSVARKKAWLGPLYHLRSVAGNDVARSHVPQTRCAFRYEAYMEEVAYLQSRAACDMSCRAMRTPMEEEMDIMDIVGVSREELLQRRWSGMDILEKMRTRGRPQSKGTSCAAARWREERRWDDRPAHIGPTQDVSHI